MVCSEKLRRWSSSSIVLRRWVTGTPPVTHTYTRAIKQPTLHYLTRSVRRAAATCKQRLRTSEICRGNGPATSEYPTIRPGDHWKIRSKDDLRVADDTSRDDLDDARSWFIGG